MAQKTHVKGTKFYVGDVNGANFVEVADVHGLMPPRKKRGVAETTILAPTDDYRTYIPGFKEGGTPTLKLRYGADQHETLDNAFESDNLLSYKIEFPLIGAQTNHSKWVWFAIIEDLGLPEKSTDGENTWETEAQFKISGKPVFTKGS